MLEGEVKPSSFAYFHNWYANILIIFKNATENILARHTVTRIPLSFAQKWEKIE